MYFLGFLIIFLLNASQSIALKVNYEEEWMGIYSGGDKIGYSHTIYKPKRENLQIFEETKLNMDTLGTKQVVDITSTYLLNKYELQAFEFSMKVGPVQFSAEGKKEGKKLDIQISSVSGKSNITFPIENEPLVSPIIFKWLAEQKPRVGKSYQVTLFDPTLILTGADAKSLLATLSIEGEEQIKTPYGSFKTYRVKMLFMGSESTYWITKEGEIIKEFSQPGLLALRESKEKVLGETLQSLDIVQKTAISSNVSLDNPRTLKFLRIKIDGIESPKEPNLEDNRNLFKDGIIEVRRSDLSQIIPYEIPYTEEAYKSYIKPTSLIQSDDPKIIEESVEILRGEKDSLRAAKEINNWVYKKLEKAPTVSLPNALDVLQTRRGDCNEHAALFAALSRAAGIPTKIVFGVVYVNGKFYYHAWNEVFLGSWIPVDPTFGQLPADASHIKIVEGDLNRGSEIIRLVGKIKIEILDAS
ncbi:MAG TPA: transglutaminase domain-containing protein [Thermodesulfobacteriota bacterium]|nr:transglutaminase domain-containing protein [Thermodesulfobacteriota bacterium]